MRERKPLAAEMVIGSIGDFGDGKSKCRSKKKSREILEFRDERGDKG
jgi:hypothetical protein